MAFLCVGCPLWESGAVCYVNYHFRCPSDSSEDAPIYDQYADDPQEKGLCND